jgi:isochorismate synthase
MYDELKYRIPGEDSVVQKGAFQKQLNLQDYSGFILSDFLQQNVFAFYPGKSLSFGSNKIKTPRVLTRKEYLSFGNEFLHEIKKNNLGKAVFSRVKEVSIHYNAKEKLFDALCANYPQAFVYELKSQEFGHWVGATPETLLEGEHGDFETAALASTKKVEDATDWGEKEIEEQALVTRFIEDRLNKLNLKFIVEGRNELVAGPVKHLHTKFSSIEGEDAHLLIGELHPTPAVSGLPRAEAIELIERVESHDRSLYTGFIGLLKNDAHVYVNLRCLQIIGEKAYLYLGGGYTKDSEVEKEWEETENKAKTLIKVLENL